MSNINMSEDLVSQMNKVNLAGSDNKAGSAIDAKEETKEEQAKATLDPVAVEQEEMKKKMMQGFSEMQQPEEMICKRLKKE
jgi:hypothetical protein